ncbi:MAG: hypothetical protein QOE00_272, partial [Ilumatobacteraceae bacterium]
YDRERPEHSPGLGEQLVERDELAVERDRVALGTGAETGKHALQDDTRRQLVVTSQCHQPTHRLVVRAIGLDAETGQHQQLIQGAQHPRCQRPGAGADQHGAATANEVPLALQPGEEVPMMGERCHGRSVQWPPHRWSHCQPHRAHLTVEFFVV